MEQVPLTRRNPAPMIEPRAPLFGEVGDDVVQFVPGDLIALEFGGKAASRTDYRKDTLAARTIQRFQLSGERHVVSLGAGRVPHGSDGRLQLGHQRWEATLPHRRHARKRIVKHEYARARLVDDLISALRIPWSRSA